MFDASLADLDAFEREESDRPVDPREQFQRMAVERFGAGGGCEWWVTE